MNKKNVSIIDYGASNMLNVQHAFEYLNVNVNVISTPEEILSAERLVFPGVGAFPDAMQQINDKGLAESITEASNNKPFLGICLGMQLMLSQSEEFELTKGLNLISGSVSPLPKLNSENETVISPHVGWSEIQYHKGNTLLFTEIPQSSAFYFVHSFHAKLANDQHLLATTQLDEFKITAMIQKDNLLGCQFHPEKSGKLGLQLINNFLNV